MAARRTVGPEAGRAALAAALAGLRPSAGPGEPPAPPPDRGTLRTAVTYTLRLLTAKAPGRAVEVRIPPLAAVQAIPGPTHRRGTPSAVVEMDPGTWLALAAGQLSWDRALADGRIRASGERADLSPWLPLVR